MRQTHPFSSGSIGRRGVAILWALFVLVILSAVIGAITWQHLAGRTLLGQRQKRLQADWLARAGIEIALSRLLESPHAYRGDVADLLSDSKVHIEIQSIAGSTTSFAVKSEAQYPTNDTHPIVRTLSREVRRVAEKGQIRFEPAKPGKKK